MIKNDNTPSNTVYRSPDGERWRIGTSPKYHNLKGELVPLAIKVKDGHVNWDTSMVNNLIEESEWIKIRKNLIKLKLHITPTGQGVYECYAKIGNRFLKEEGTYRENAICHWINKYGPIFGIDLNHL